MLITMHGGNTQNIFLDENGGNTVTKAPTTDIAILFLKNSLVHPFIFFVHLLS